MHPTSTIWHCRGPTRRSSARLRAASRRFVEITAGIAVLEPSSPRCLGFILCHFDCRLAPRRLASVEILIDHPIFRNGNTAEPESRSSHALVYSGHKILIKAGGFNDLADIAPQFGSSK